MYDFAEPLTTLSLLHGVEKSIMAVNEGAEGKLRDNGNFPATEACKKAKKVRQFPISFHLQIDQFRASA